MENIVAVEAGMFVILTQAAKAKDEEIVGSVEESEGNGTLRNCPAEMLTKLF